MRDLGSHTALCTLKSSTLGLMLCCCSYNSLIMLNKGPHIFTLYSALQIMQLVLTETIQAKENSGEKDTINIFRNIAQNNINMKQEQYVKKKKKDNKENQKVITSMLPC